MKEAILEWLAKGVQAMEVASMVGCTPAYVSQLCKDPDFVQLVEERRVSYLAEVLPASRLEDRYESLEHKLISAAEATLGAAELPAVMMALGALHKRQAMKRPSYIPEGMGGPLSGHNVTNIQHNTQIISLTLPAHAIAQRESSVELNSQSEVVAIDNQSLAPMPAMAVKDLFARRKEAQEALVKQNEASRLLETEL